MLMLSAGCISFPPIEPLCLLFCSPGLALKDRSGRPWPRRSPCKVHRSCSSTGRPSMPRLAPPRSRPVVMPRVATGAISPIRMAVASLVEAVRREHGTELHALVHMAGGFAMSGPVAESSFEVWNRQIAINLTTAYLTARAFLPMLRAGHGSIVFFASEVALPGATGSNRSAYAVAKSGVATLMRSIAAEEAKEWRAGQRRGSHRDPDRGQRGRHGRWRAIHRARASRIRSHIPLFRRRECDHRRAAPALMTLAVKRRIQARSAVLDRSLEALPLFRLSDAPDDSALTYTTEEGGRWRVLASPGDRLPGTFDQDVYVELMRRFDEAGTPADGVLSFTLHAFLRTMGRQVDGRTYEQLRASLTRLERTALQSENSYFEAGPNGLATAELHIAHLRHDRAPAGVRARSTCPVSERRGRRAGRSTSRRVAGGQTEYRGSACGVVERASVPVTSVTRGSPIVPLDRGRPSGRRRDMADQSRSAAPAIAACPALPVAFAARPAAGPRDASGERRHPGCSRPTGAGGSGLSITCSPKGERRGHESARTVSDWTCINVQISCPPSSTRLSAARSKSMAKRSPSPFRLTGSG